MADDDESERDRLLISAAWRDATECISLAASGTLIALIGMAANAGKTAIAVSAANMAPHIRHEEDRAAFPARFAELRLRGLVREVRPGVFEIAPGLWKVGRWNGEKDFFPYV